MILVTGGAGYIGSHYVQYATQQGTAVVVLDNLAYGHREAVPDGAPFVEYAQFESEIRMVAV